MISVDVIKEKYPLHYLVWKNDIGELSNALEYADEETKEKLDPKGRSPLMLAVKLGHIESVKILLKYNVNINVEGQDCWTVVHEAIATKDPELLQIILEERNFRRYHRRALGIPKLLEKLEQSPDFYVEMKWEFTSWVPFISQFCPHDTYRVYKKGCHVRIDTTLLGFDHNSWQRGNRSYIFSTEENGQALLLDIDHDAQIIYKEQMQTIDDACLLQSSNEIISAKLISPITTTYLDTEKIVFERAKSGIWGWRSNKVENINGYECKVFYASNVQLVTKTRTEHLEQKEKEQFFSKASLDPVRTLLNFGDNQTEVSDNKKENNNFCNISLEEYFDPSCGLQDKDIGKPLDVNIKIQKFKATLWLCNSFPLQLAEQILPIIEIMSTSNSHFSRLKDFIHLQLPNGFPVKIEIPLFHVLNAQITFSNIYGINNPVPGVHYYQDTNDLTCTIDKSCFDPPQGYQNIIDGLSFNSALDEEEELMQYAIQQSLLEIGTEGEEVDIWEALKGQKFCKSSSILNNEDKLLQRAIEQSLSVTTSASIIENEVDQLQFAIELSKEEQNHIEQLLKHEQEELEHILQLSLREQ